MEQSEEDIFLFAMQLATGAVLPMALKSAIELDLLELIKKTGTAASAPELAAQLQTENPDAASMVDRILRLLAANSILICTLKALPDGGLERRYSLAPVCKYLTRNEDGVSLAPMSLMIHDRATMEAWYHMKDTVVGGGVPFDRAHGMRLYEYQATDPRFKELFNKPMHGHSNIVMKRILEIYRGFEGLESLLDVGGGTGATLDMIISKYPSIKGINFDLPHVVQDAPSYPGVEHIGGDMFVSVPKARAIFMKWICHNWSDAHCQKLLKNCYEALLENGKVIIADCVLPEDPNFGLPLAEGAQMDVLMLANTSGGKERTEKEFQALAKQGGFKELRKICQSFNISIMELYK